MFFQDDHCRAEVERVDSGVGSEIKEYMRPNIEIWVNLFRLFYILCPSPLYLINYTGFLPALEKIEK